MGGADPVAARLEFHPARYDDDVAADLVEQVQEEYVVRYGGRDGAPVDPDEFSPPHGHFLMVLLDGTAVGCGGWRDLGDGRIAVGCPERSPHRPSASIPPPNGRARR